MNSRELSRVTGYDEEQCRRLVQCKRILFASLRACLDVGAVDSAPNIKVAVLDQSYKFGSQTHSIAASLMRKNIVCPNRERLIIGNIPGVLVGDAFLFQAEMLVLGLHENFQGGIGFSKTSSSSSPTGLTIATSIVMSGGYEDNADDEDDVLIYSGQGGRNPGRKKQTTHQVLKGGNLALKNSMDNGIEIRVIRGVKLSQADNMIYFYDGLYKVQTYWYVPGQSGFNVYKFKLHRLPGQGAMGSMMYRKANQQRAGMLDLPQGQQVFDPSRELEVLPVSFYGGVSGSFFNPFSFKYLHRLGLFYRTLGACNCTENCSAADGNECLCVSLNGGELPYNKSGVLLHGKHLVFECGPRCQCPSTCPNRVSQKGLTRRLQVFRSEATGTWEVRSLDFIPAGTFVCEITGEVTSLSESQQQQYMNKVATNNLSVQDPILMFPAKLPRWWMEWGNITPVLPGYKPPVNMFEGIAPDLHHIVIDMTVARNVGCYLRNSRIPNLFAQFVLFDHHDMTKPHIMIFALHDILPMTELTLDYGTTDG